MEIGEGRNIYYVADLERTAGVEHDDVGVAILEKVVGTVELLLARPTSSFGLHSL